ncbi:hypothetical protein ONE63_002534 [Megalurothrips usitatus]|uniref:Uncharacterized protein n=1 Tax=Megalurothrips usitatus TaxID=439358 RepID=A0AAV7XC66_9NEOP|nr:hypothetical protein ONE63_002534 [Megalurothrips usitatus]
MMRRRVAFTGMSTDTGVPEGRRQAGPRRHRVRPRNSSRDSASAGDWSPPRPRSATPPSTSTGSAGSYGDSEHSEAVNADDESTPCAELVRERALVLHSHHRVVALVRAQVLRLLAEDAALAVPPVRGGPRLLGLGGHISQGKRAAAESVLLQLVSGLAPVLVLAAVAALSALSALLGALASPWQPPPPPSPPQSCLGRLMAAFLPTWSIRDDSPLLRPF